MNASCVQPPLANPSVHYMYTPIPLAISRTFVSALRLWWLCHCLKEQSHRADSVGPGNVNSLRFYTNTAVRELDDIHFCTYGLGTYWK